jgi:hypothetical protein
MSLRHGGIQVQIRARTIRAWLFSFALVATVSSVPAVAGSTMGPAERLHRLDMMLKLSSARCAQSGSDLRADYIQFVRNHQFALGQARRELLTELGQRYGRAGAERAYDRMNYQIADVYRRNHPWLSCAELKVAAHGLAAVEGSPTLLEAADQILPESASRHLAMLRQE